MQEKFTWFQDLHILSGPFDAPKTAVYEHWGELYNFVKGF